MTTQLVEKDGVRYLEAASPETPLRAERDALDLVAACLGQGTSLLLLRSAAVSGDFFRLGTGLAGQALQKFSNYRLKVALVVEDEKKMIGKFRELAEESRRSGEFRVCSTVEEAERWLAG